MPLLFVYGTLRRGEPNHDVLAATGATFVARAVTRAPRRLVDLGPYPALLSEGAPGPAAPVEGELWNVPPSALAILDDFEGAPNLYVRERIALCLAGRRDLEAEVYVYARPVPGGRAGTSP